MTYPGATTFPGSSTYPGIVAPVIPAVVGTSGGTQPGGGTLAITPATGAVSWIAVLYEYCNGVTATTLVAPAGWTLVDRYQSPYNSFIHVYQSSSSTPGTTWTYGSGVDAITLTGVVVGYDSALTSVALSKTEDSQVSPSATTTGEALVLRAAADGPNSTTGNATYPTNATLGRFQQWSANLGGYRSFVGVAHQEQATAGATGTATWSIPGEDAAVAYTIVLYGESGPEPVDVVVEVPQTVVTVSVSPPTVDTNSPTNVSVNIPLSALGVSSFEPGVTSASSVDIEAPSIVVHSLVPDVVLTRSKSVSVPLSQVGTETFSPALSASTISEADTPSVSVTALVPSVLATSNAVVTVELAQVGVVVPQPSVVSDSNVVVAAPISSVSVTSPDPVVHVRRNVSVSVPLSHAVISAPSPMVTSSAFSIVDVPASSVSVAGLDVTVTVSNPDTVLVLVSGVTVSALVPDVSVTRRIVVPVPRSDIGVAVFVPTVSTIEPADLPFVVLGPYLADRLITGPYTH